MKGRPLTIRERYAVAARCKDNKKTKCKELPTSLELAIGMQVMVTYNIETEADLTNGARGEITEIVLHSEEPPIEEGVSIIKLNRLPAYVL